jgi:hypothetical protein
LAAALLGALGLVGCGGDQGVPLYPAEGRVVVDGRPAAGVVVRLHPADRLQDVDAARPFATTDTDGAFRLGTRTDGDGAPEGRYKLTLFLPDRPPGPAPPRDLLGGRYARPETSPLEVRIAPGPNRLGPFDVTAPAARPTAKAPPPRPRRPDPDALP